MAFSKISCVMFFLVLGLVSADDCPSFWTRYGNHCYRFFGPPKNWQSAEEHCQEFFTRKGQGHLASIHSSGENDFLIQLWTTSLVPNSDSEGISVWLGHNDRELEGYFSWSDGTACAYDLVYTAWRQGQPDDSNGEDCGSFSLSEATASNPIGWNDYSCETAVPYFCKMPIE